VIGDDLADTAGAALDELVDKLAKQYPDITKAQVLHTVAFCSGYLTHFDTGKRDLAGSHTKVLQVMTLQQRIEFSEQHRVPKDESIMVAPGTGLRNVHNPFSGGVI